MDRKSGIILAFGVFLILYLVVPRGSSNGLPRPTRRGSALEGLKILQVAEGEEHWVLRARSADLLEETEAADLIDVELEVRDPPGLSVTGREGRYEFSGQTLELRGDVAIRGSGWVLRTDVAVWDNRAGRLRSDRPVRMEGRTFDLVGTGLDIDAGRQIARTTDVTCTFRSF